jgi:phospho-N-acetylmuramoyl-pentapeptide-transferase
MLLLFTLASVLPCTITLLLFPGFIKALKQFSLGQAIREDGPSSHLKKQGTPTGGGVLLLAALLTPLPAVKTIVTTPAFLWTLLVTLTLGCLGMWDDGLKLLKKHNKGLGGYSKLAVQTLVGLALGWAQVTFLHDTDINVFGMMVPVGHWHMLFTAFVVVASSNAVNLTDGLDGLAGGALVASFVGCFLFLAALVVQGVGTPIATQAFAGALLALMLVGVLLAFLCFNHHPAKVFMGDSGSLAFGGTLASLMLICNLDAWYLCCGLLYVVEAWSVVLQVSGFKLWGKRLFKMAPIHHHFELLGWSEQRVVRTFVYTHAAVVMLGVALFVLGL